MKLSYYVLGIFTGVMWFSSVCADPYTPQVGDTMFKISESMTPLFVIEGVTGDLVVLTNQKKEVLRIHEGKILKLDEEGLKATQKILGTLPMQLQNQNKGGK